MRQILYSCIFDVQCHLKLCMSLINDMIFISVQVYVRGTCKMSDIGLLECTGFLETGCLFQVLLYSSEVFHQLHNLSIVGQK